MRRPQVPSLSAIEVAVSLAASTQNRSHLGITKFQIPTQIQEPCRGITRLSRRSAFTALAKASSSSSHIGIIRFAVDSTCRLTASSLRSHSMAVAFVVVVAAGGGRCIGCSGGAFVVFSPEFSAAQYLYTSLASWWFNLYS